MNKKAVIILGPTATHKTKLSLFLAERFPFEIISADSMQFYKEMDIGTDKIPLSQRKIIPHHLIDIITIEEEFSIAQFEVRAEKIMNEILARKHYPLIVGGSGLYIRALTEGFPVEDFAPPDKKLREELSALSISELRSAAEKIDPLSANRVGKNDRKRLIRIIEFYRGTGKRLSEVENRKTDFQFLKIGLIKRRDILYRDIEKRVDEMFEQGFVKEVVRLSEKYGKWSKTALQAIGYKEILAYLRGKLSLDMAKEEIKKRTRHLAKRQITWFKKEKNVHWINSEDFERAKKEAVTLVGEFLKPYGGAEGI